MSRVSHEFDNIQSGKLTTGDPPFSEQLNGTKLHLKESKAYRLKPNPMLPSPIKSAKSRFCCIAKEYFSEYSGLVDSLQITPRVIVYNNSLRKNIKYGMIINLKNNALYPRYFEYYTDSPTDTTINIADLDSHRFLQPDESLELNITIQPKTTKLINRRRHIFIESDHPNIVFQVPIIVLFQMKDASIPDTITFPSCTPGNITYFEFIAYNPTKDPAKIKIASSFPGLDINMLDRSIIPKKDYLQILLSLKTKTLQVLTGSLSVKFFSERPRLMEFNFTPKLVSVHISLGRINFGTVKFERQLKRTVTICNEGAADVTLEADFLNEQPMGYSETSENDLSRGGEFKDAASLHSALVSNSELCKHVNSNADSKIEIPSTSAMHFRIHAPESLKAFSSEEAMVIFHPLYDLNSPFDDKLDPPYFVRTKLFLCFADKNKCMQSNWLQITGAIGGMEIELYPKIIDFRKIYLGEEHCSFIRVLNIDGQLNAQVKFKDFTDPIDAGVQVTPNEGFLLRPCEKQNFHLALFSKVPHKFNVFLRFKVTNGGHYRFTVKGQGLRVQLRIFPQLVEFGSVPIGVPQKRYMLLMNPLSVPITLQVCPTDDGDEQPLVLNIKEENELMPITVRDPVVQLQQINNELKDGGYEPTEILVTDTDPEGVSYCSVDTKASVYSLVFEEEVMEPISSMAQQLITILKKQKIFDKSETDKRVVQEAMNYFMNNRYFSGLVKHSNFVYMDWNAVPADPKEVYCDNEIIYLRPNTGKSITVLIIPNNAGYFHRCLTVRICPTNFASAEGGEVERTLIKTEFLCSKLWFEYNCCIPHIEWVNVISLLHRIVYAGEGYHFDMTFANNSTVAGFLHFDVIPSEMSFRDGVWKFYIGAQDRVMARCSVSFRTIGPTKLSGLIRVVGSHRSYPFHIIADVLPTAVQVTPKAVRRRLHVLEINKTHVFIDNATPTHTLVQMHLKDENIDQYLTKEGCLLAAFGQSTYTTLVSQFTDPDTYTNTICIDLQFNHVLELPLTFIVEGVPIYFEPDIKEGFNVGPIFTDSKESFQSNRANYSEVVRVSNRGKRPYRLVITRLKTYAKPLNGNKKALCAAEPLKARFDIWPKNLFLHPKSSDFLTMNASAYEECISHTDFRVDVIDHNNPQKVYTMRIAMVATFLDCNLTWSKKQLCFNYQRTHVKNEKPYIETAEIVNPYANPVEAVFLKANGPFRMKEHFEQQFQKDICIRLEPMERKEIFVVLNKAPLKDVACKSLDGRICAFACGRVQKSLSLKVNLLVANVVILQTEILLFSRGQESNHIVEVTNFGCATAEFKWKRLEVKQEFIDEVDIPKEFIDDLLSEILRVVEYRLEDYEETENMTNKYRKYSCKYVFRNDETNIVMDILDEIIDNLDLTHKRYLINLRYKTDGEETSDEGMKSSRSYVRHTLSEVINQIKLESSFEPSQASSEYCFAEHSLYFYEKSGHVAPGETKRCLLHVPHIRRSYEVTAIFRLDVVGGRSEVLNVKLVNIAEKVKLYNDIYLHVKPWYENCRSELKVRNITKYPLKLTIEDYTKANTRQRCLINGCAKIISNEPVHLEAFGTVSIKIETILGFNESFKHIFCMSINDSDHTYFCVRGHGIMPILTVTSLLKETEQDPIEILEEYLILQEMYYFEIFKNITEIEEESQVTPIEEEYEKSEKSVSISECDDELMETFENMQPKRCLDHEFIFFKLFQSYIWINNNEDLPNAIILKQLLETTKYIKRLHANSAMYKMHQKVYQIFVNAQKSFDKQMPINLKHFRIQQIPCELHGNTLDLGNLKLNTFKRFSFALHFFGPGKLIVGVRSAVRIPGLYIDLKIDKPSGKPFIYWAEKCNTPEFFKKKYRNMLERALDFDLDRRIHHSHSFDIDKCEKHQRDINVSNRRIIEKYYTGLNPSVYADHKHHFYFAKIYPKQNSNIANADLLIMGLFKPESRHYKAGQRIEDFIYIDLHMGPTLPILLRGLLEN